MADPKPLIVLDRLQRASYNPKDVEQGGIEPIERAGVAHVTSWISCLSHRSLSRAGASIGSLPE